MMSRIDARWTALREIRDAVHLQQRLLDFIFPEVGLAGVGGGTHVIGVEGF